jgi:dihydrofolate reductase
MRISLIVAVARNNVIGKDGALPWKLSADLKRFKALTMGKPVIMGRKTYESIGKPLPGRDNIIVSRVGFRAEGTRTAPSVAEAIALADGAEAMVIGGAAIYAAMLPLAERIHLTRVDAAIDGDALFPIINEADWRRTAAGSAPVSPRDAYACRYFVLDRLLWPR